MNGAPKLFLRRVWRAGNAQPGSYWQVLLLWLALMTGAFLLVHLFVGGWVTPAISLSLFGVASLLGDVRRFRRRRQQLATAATRPVAP